MAEKVPGWVERILIPSLESRVRGAVRDEVEHLAKVQDAKFEAVSTRIGSLEKRMDDRFDGVGTKIDSLEKRISLIQDISDLKERLAAVEKRA